MFIGGTGIPLSSTTSSMLIVTLMVSIKLMCASYIDSSAIRSIIVAVLVSLGDLSALIKWAGIGNLVPLLNFTAVEWILISMFCRPFWIYRPESINMIFFNWPQALETTWKGMRWIMDVLQYARDKQLRGGVPLSVLYAPPPSPVDSPMDVIGDMENVFNGKS